MSMAFNKKIVGDDFLRSLRKAEHTGARFPGTAEIYSSFIPELKIFLAEELTKIPNSVFAEEDRTRVQEGKLPIHITEMPYPEIVERLIQKFGYGVGSLTGFAMIEQIDSFDDLAKQFADFHLLHVNAQIALAKHPQQSPADVIFEMLLGVNGRQPQFRRYTGEITTMAGAFTAIEHSALTPQGTNGINLKEGLDWRDKSQYDQTAGQRAIANCKPLSIMMHLVMREFGYASEMCFARIKGSEENHVFTIDDKKLSENVLLNGRENPDFSDMYRFQETDMYGVLADSVFGRIDLEKKAGLIDSEQEMSLRRLMIQLNPNDYESYMVLAGYYREAAMVIYHEYKNIILEKPEEIPQKKISDMCELLKKAVDALSEIDRISKEYQKYQKNIGQLLQNRVVAGERNWWGELSAANSIYLTETQAFLDWQIDFFHLG
jgi:hypothetical protein